MGISDAFLNEQMYIIAIISIILFLVSCAGLAVFITYRILKKYIDFGDVVCSIHQYSSNGIKYSVNRDNVLLYEKNDYMLVHGDNPYENLERSIPDQLLKNAGKTADDRVNLSH